MIRCGSRSETAGSAFGGHELRETASGDTISKSGGGGWLAWGWYCYPHPCRSAFQRCGKYRPRISQCLIPIAPRMCSCAGEVVMGRNRQSGET